MKKFSWKAAIAVVIASTFVVTAFGTLIPAEQKRSYIVSTDLLKRTNLDRIAEQQNSLLSIVKMTPSEAVAFSQRLHDVRRACGGMMDVTAEVEHFGAGRVLDVASKVPLRLASFDKVDPTNPAQAALLISKTDKVRMWNFLKSLSSFPDRSANTENGVKAAKLLGAYAQDLAGKAGRSVEVSFFETKAGPFKSYIQPSTVVRLPGSDPTLPGVILGGHMDTFENNKPGADDDGTGVASVMEIFESVMHSGLKFKRDIYFMFYAAEERGLVGSGVVAKKLTQAGFKFRSALQFDMTGFKSHKDVQDIYLITDYVDQGLTQFLEKLLIRYVGVPASKIGHTKCNYACSDHASWHQQGVPSAFPFEASFENDNKTIHTEDDKMDILDLDHAYTFVKLGAAYIAEVADPE